MVAQSDLPSASVKICFSAINTFFNFFISSNSSSCFFTKIHYKVTGDCALGNKNWMVINNFLEGGYWWVISDSKRTLLKRFYITTLCSRLDAVVHYWSCCTTSRQLIYLDVLLKTLWNNCSSCNLTKFLFIKEPVSIWIPNLSKSAKPKEPSSGHFEKFFFSQSDFSLFLVTG